MTHPRYDGTVIDAHTHFDIASGNLADVILEKTGLGSCVNLWDARWPPLPFGQWSSPWKRMGQKMAVCHVPDLSSVGTANFVSRVTEDLRHAAASGAAGVKVWKNLGLWLRDGSGARVSVDDDRLRVLWETAVEVDLPVAIHVSDPPAFFQPVTSDNERYAELHIHPEWWFGGDEYPALETVHEEFENMVGSNPDTTFIGLHFGCFMPFEEVARMLSLYDNYLVDTSARVADLGRGDVTGVRKIFDRFPDRIIFGTDLVRVEEFDMPDLGEERDNVANFYALHWRFFETGEKNMPHPLPFQGEWTVTGLDLNQGALELLYKRNAERVYSVASETRLSAREVRSE